MRDATHCYRKACRCTHTDGCDHGWIDLDPITNHGVTYERVAPCPVCRPEAAARRDNAARGARHAS